MKKPQVFISCSKSSGVHPNDARMNPMTYTCTGRVPGYLKPRYWLIKYAGVAFGKEGENWMRIFQDDERYVMCSCNVFPH
jgi:hypothetical protein